MISMTIEEFRKTIKSQGVEHNDFAFKCPMCGTIQSARMLIAAGAGKDFEEVEKYLGFSCVGRFTGKGSPSKEKGNNHGCNWTLGGLFSMHELEVVTPDGNKHPRFEVATPEEAKALAVKFGAFESKGAQS